MKNHIMLEMLDYEEKLSLYGRTAFDYLIMDAVFSDETENFISPSEPSSDEPVTVSIRVFHDNVDQVFIHYACGTTEYGGCRELSRIRTEDLSDVYGVTFEQIPCVMRYYFSIHKGVRRYVYNRQGVCEHADENFHFTIAPDFHPPAWARGAVMYQIYVDRFHNGDPTNDPVNNEYAYLGQAAKKVEKWDRDVNTVDFCDFYGGDLAGVMQKMSYLKDLGVEVIYFTPIFVSPSNHKYDIQDYDYVDPHIGVIVEDGGSPLYFEKFHNRYATMYMQRTTNKANLEASNQLLIRLIETAHANGIRIILDGVFNHCGAFNKWLDKANFYSKKGYPNGAYLDENSPYHDYFLWYDRNWPNNDCYDCWWGHDNHPKLHYENSKELYEYMMDIGRKWVSPPFNADGWRLDVAADLGRSPAFNHQFWRDFRKAVKEANPEAVILAEHYGDPFEWLQGDQWDTTMNYDAFMNPVTWFLTGMEKHSEDFQSEMLCNAGAFESAMRYQMSRYPAQSLQTAMNQLSNHDHSRFLTRTNRQVGRYHTKGAEAASQGVNKYVMLEAVALQMTWPGAPTLYYGDEAGLAGWTDPDNRRPFPWGREDMTLLNAHKAFIALRKPYSALKTGSVEFLLTGFGVLAYGRWDQNNSLVVILNNYGEPREFSIPVWRCRMKRHGQVEQLIETSAEVGFSLEKTRLPVIDGYVRVQMGSYGSKVLIEV